MYLLPDLRQQDERPVSWGGYRSPLGHTAGLVWRQVHITRTAFREAWWTLSWEDVISTRWPSKESQDDQEKREWRSKAFIIWEKLWPESQITGKGILDLLLHPQVYWGFSLEDILPGLCISNYLWWRSSFPTLFAISHMGLMLKRSHHMRSTPKPIHT